MLKGPDSAPPVTPVINEQASGEHSESASAATVVVELPSRQEQSHGVRSWLRRGFLAAVVIGVIAGIAALMRKTGPESVSGTTLTHTIARADLLVTVTEKGTLESSNNVEVRSKVWGWKTVNWVIESGAEVKKDDLLVELDASEMEKKVDDAKINYHNAVADKITAESNVAVATKSIDEYMQGTFIEERGGLLQEIFDAEQDVRKAEAAYASMERMAAKGIMKTLQLEGAKFTVDSAQQKLKLKQTKLVSLEKFKKEKQKEKLESDLRAAQARLDAAEAKVNLAKTNVDQHEEQLRFHTIVAPQDGMVIHPKAAAHRNAPDVEEGANVHTNQVLLIMPDLDQMQVKLGIHESMIDRVSEGLSAKVTVGDVTLDGEVSEVAKVTKPATWYTGNVVKFDTVVTMESYPGLKPGLSAEVEVVIAEHSDVLTIPVAAVVESGEKRYCWVNTPAGPRRREVGLGDSNKQFIVVESGLAEGDEVVLNPAAFLDEAELEAMKPVVDQEAEGGPDAATPSPEDAPSTPS